MLIGAMTRQAMVEKSHEVKTTCPLLADATSYVGTWQIRNRGTVGGSLAHADPSAEIPLVWPTCWTRCAARGEIDQRGGFVNASGRPGS